MRARQIDKRETRTTTADERLTMGSSLANRAGKAAAEGGEERRGEARGEKGYSARGSGTKRGRREGKQEERRWEGSHEWRQSDAGRGDEKVKRGGRGRDSLGWRSRIVRRRHLAITWPKRAPFSAGRRTRSFLWMDGSYHWSFGLNENITYVVTAVRHRRHTASALAARRSTLDTRHSTRFYVRFNVLYGRLAFHGSRVLVIAMLLAMLMIIMMMMMTMIMMRMTMTMVREGDSRQHQCRHRHRHLRRLITIRFSVAFFVLCSKILDPNARTIIDNVIDRYQREREERGEERRSGTRRVWCRVLATCFRDLKSVTLRYRLRDTISRIHRRTISPSEIFSDN